MMNEESNGQFVKDEFIGEDDGNRIAEAVVFTDQAYLTRQVRRQVQAGLNRLLIEVKAFAVEGDSAQIPVSKTDRIQIKGVEIIPEPKQRNHQGREGVMLWELQMAPKSVREIRIKFFVKHPKRNPPYGL